MKITLVPCDTDEPEVILKYKTLDDDMLHILSFLKSQSQKVLAFKERTQTLLLIPSDILYCESVDDKVFLYCDDDVYQTPLSLLELENQYSSLGFFRISKSMVINLNRITKLSSCASGKIHALLANNETVIVSRHYAPLLRQTLLTSHKN